jgi:predicted GNAT superfamily acetyltransferase
MTGVAEKKPGVAAVTIRKCETLAEMHACFALQKEVWKFADAELVPVRIFVVAEKIGGQVIGAFIPGNRADGNDELIGFALAIPGVRNRHSYLHSQMLAIRQQYRNRGLGRRIKLHQREDALARGFDLMEWTFDPLEIKNAYLNIEKLGAIARRYQREPIRHHLVALAGRIAHGPAGGGMVDEVKTCRSRAGGRSSRHLRMPRAHRGSG